MLKQAHTEGIIEVGCDEAGRGCLAGPVFAGAVILDPLKEIPELNDSKKLNEKKRLYLRERIEEDALAFSVAKVDPAEIDEINILNASFLAMHRALDKLKQNFDTILVDGNRFHPYKDISFHCIVKGDGIYASIAAASILAKTYRDDYMYALHQDYPVYAWGKNKGYPTQAHREAILESGACQHHRKSFRLINEQLSIDF